MPRWIDAIWPKSRDSGRWGSPVQTDAIWQQVVASFGFLVALDVASKNQLQELSLRFLKEKEFQGAHGLQITDTMAMAIASQACLPLLHMGPANKVLGWYEDFVGIVVHPAEMRALRESVDEAGVVHHYHEELAGEAMAGGPVTLNWQDVANAGPDAALGRNLVIHEFAHKLDMRSGEADGCPPLPHGFMGIASAVQARKQWQATIEPAFESFKEQAILAERFGQPPPWLDTYAAHSLPEFFAVACEAYFVNRERFAADFPALMPMFDHFFDRRGPS